MIFNGISDDEIDALYDKWRDELYFDRLLLGISLYLYLLLATPHGLKILFMPFLMPFYLWGLLPVSELYSP